ncbi:MAG: imidazole glycerol phosphate synthase subunit HisF [Bacteroidetes bacterium MedPE-SWsnd-G2]|nr:MAG: imidazole glycerol phosphate synthase subunit HisF [Bacteroidetes bacterium MedPE-SWsnd-G2]
MLTKRIIPCLDIHNGRTVKGVNFKNLKDAGDPIALAKMYAKVGADELVFLDISATIEQRQTTLNLVLKIAEHIDIPFTVGGGINTVKDVELLLNNGADKIAINSAAINNPQLIADLVSRFGSQCITVAIDAYCENDKWEVYKNGGTVSTSKNLFEWAKTVEKLGAGEILFTAMNNDGTKKGFANQALFQLSKEVNIPIIASGGAGNIDHFSDAFEKGNADAALAASVFHYGEINIQKLKYKLKQKGIAVRL